MKAIRQDRRKIYKPAIPRSHVTAHAMQPLRQSNSELGGSENHAQSVHPFHEPRLHIGLDTRKNIAVQRSLLQVTQS